MKGRKEEITPAVVRNKDWCFHVGVYNGCCAGLHNKRFEGNEDSLCVYLYVCLSKVRNKAEDKGTKKERNEEMKKEHLL
jgi:hypothetical protein